MLGGRFEPTKSTTLFLQREVRDGDVYGVQKGEQMEHDVLRSSELAEGEVTFSQENTGADEACKSVQCCH